MSKAPLQTTTDVACTRCGCVCDDLTITTKDDRITGLLPGCRLADSWLLDQTSASMPPARIFGEVVSIPDAVAHAAAVLQASVSPLVYGLSGSSTPGQCAAVRLADQIGACIDSTASTCHAPSIVALQDVGESTSSLGETRNRSDLIVYWGSNPAKSHPRHMERFVDAQGLFIPNGRSDRHVVVVDVKPSETSEFADTFIKVEPGNDFEMIWALRSLVNGMEPAIDSVTGVSRHCLGALTDRMKACRHGSVFFGLGLTRHGIAHMNVQALLRLVTDLNHHTRFVARRMRIPGDVAGADSVLCWQTGYPFSVNLNRPYPRYNPGEFTANDMLERDEVDAVLLVGTEGVDKLSHAAQDRLRSLPCIVLDHPETEGPVPAEVHFRTAIYGIHRPGTAYRMDEIPIPLRPVLSSPLPSDHDILDDITRTIIATAAVATRPSGITNAKVS